MKKAKNIIFIIVIVTLFSAGTLFFLKKKQEILKKQKEVTTSEGKEERKIEIDKSKPKAGDAIKNWRQISNPKKIEIFQEEKEELLNITICKIGFFNVTPPRTPVERLEREAKKTLEEVESAVLQGADFETVCNTRTNELKSKNSDYYGAFSQRNALNVYIMFSDDNEDVGKKLQTMSVGELQLFPIYDGPYLPDNIPENDTVYLSAYYLIRKNKLNKDL